MHYIVFFKKIFFKSHRHRHTDIQAEKIQYEGVRIRELSHTPKERLDICWGRNTLQVGIFD